MTEWVSKMESDCPLSVGQKAKEEKPKSLEWQGTNRNRLMLLTAASRIDALSPMQVVSSREWLAWDTFFKELVMRELEWPQ